MKNQKTILLIFLLIILHLTVDAQMQLGSTLVGDGPDNRFGETIYLSGNGNVLVVKGINNSGYVRTYEWTGSDWVQIGIDIAGETEEDAHGSSLALSEDGRILAIGAVFNDGGGTDSGHVRIYEWKNGRWIQLGSDIDGSNPLDESGSAVALSSDGTRVVIGSRDHDNFRGHVRIFDWDGNQWVQVGQEIDGEDTDNLSGSVVDISSEGNIIAIGAFGNAANGGSSGHTRIYTWDGNTWIQMGSDIDGDAASDRSGTSVSLSDSGNRIVIGADGNDASARTAGQVKVFDWNGTSWQQVGSDIFGEAEGDNLGEAVAISGDGNRLAAGAAFNDANGNTSGHVRIYEWKDENWVQSGDDIDGVAAGDFFGESLSMSSDGKIVAIAARNNDDNGDFSGHVRVFQIGDSSTPVAEILDDVVINIFPNPTTDYLQLTGEEFDSYRIYNQAGKILLSSNEMVSKIHITTLNSGIYYLEISKDNKIRTHKIIKSF